MATEHVLADGRIELRSVVVEKINTVMQHRPLVPVTYNNDPQQIIGTGKVVETEQGLIAYIILNRFSLRLGELTPSICYKVLEEQVGPNGKRLLIQGRLLGIGLCEGPNVDDRIRPLGEQITEIHLP